MNPTENADYPEVPEELQLEILSWLPGKSLAKFNCVSKLWDLSLTINAFLLRHSRSPISSNKFYICSSLLIQFSADSTTAHHHPGDGGDDGSEEESDYASDSDYGDGYNYNYNYAYNPDYDDNYEENDGVNQRIMKGVRVPLMNLPSDFVSGKVAVSNFCDDLVCFFTGWNYLPHLSILLYSVRFNDFVALPVRSDKPSPTSSGYVGRLLLCSLGFDPVKDEYKIVRIISGENCVNKYEILGIGSKLWKPIDDERVPLLLRQGLPHEGSFCLNGVNYWVNEYDGGDNNGMIRIAIVAFDLGCEEFRVFEVDEVVGSTFNTENHYYLTALRGCTTLFCWNRGEVLELTLSGYPNGVWARRRVMTHYLSTISLRDYQYVGGRIMVWRESSKGYCCYDIESGDNWVIKVEDELETDQVLHIRNDMEGYVTSSM